MKHHVDYAGVFFIEVDKLLMVLELRGSPVCTWLVNVHVGEPQHPVTVPVMTMITGAQYSGSYWK